jgi:hypothetical protein
MEARPELEPAAAEVAAPEETDAVPLVAATVEETLELEPATEAVAAEAVLEEGEVTPFAASTIEDVPELEPEPELIVVEVVLEDAEVAPDVAAAFEEVPDLQPVLETTSAEASPADEATLDAGEPLPLVAATEAQPQPAAMAAVAAAPEESPATPEEDKPAAGDVAATQATPELEPEPMAAEAEPQPMAAEAEPVSTQPQVTEKPVVPATLEVHPRIDRLVEITIHNHSPAGAANGALEARVASLEATLDAFARMIASVGLSQPGASVDSDVTPRLERLVELKRSGVLNDEEFAAVKAQVLGGRAQPNGLNAASDRVLR